MNQEQIKTEQIGQKEGMRVDCNKGKKKRMTSTKNSQSEHKNTIDKVFCSQCQFNPNHQQQIQCKCEKGQIYLGGSAVLTSQILSNHQIGAVLSVMDCKRYEKENIGQKVEDLDEIQQHQFIDVSNDHPDLLPYLNHSYDYITEVLSRGFNILIHSNDGLSRSPAILIHYLIKKYKIDFETALNFVKSKRQQISLNPQFSQQLSSIKY